MPTTKHNGQSNDVDPRESLMRISDWYKGVLITWAVLGLPSLFLAYGFSGGSVSAPNFSQADLFDIVIWLIAWTLIFAPIFLAPFGVHRRDANRPEDSD